MLVELCQSNRLTLSGIIVAVLLSVGSALAGTSEGCRAVLRPCRPLAEQGVDVAQTTLGIMYERGLGGLAQDDAEAVKWYRKAAEQGVAFAQDRLA